MVNIDFSLIARHPNSEPNNNKLQIYIQAAQKIEFCDRIPPPTNKLGYRNILVHFTNSHRCLIRPDLQYACSVAFGFRNSNSEKQMKTSLSELAPAKQSNHEHFLFFFLCSCFFFRQTKGGAGAGLQYPAYFKDAKGNNHSVFGGNLGSLQFGLKPGQKGMLPDVLQQGRNAGMPLYVRCPICQKEFKQKSTLLQHGCIHIESRPYPCPECGKRFRQQSHLTQHLRIHTNEKPYGCIYCPRFFRQRTILNQVRVLRSVRFSISIREKKLMYLIRFGSLLAYGHFLS